MSETVTVKKEALVNIHNALAGLHPTGEDIIVVAAAMMDLRKLLQNEEQEEEQDG